MKTVIFASVAVLSAFASQCRASEAPDDFLPCGRMTLGVNYWASHAATEMWRKWDAKAVEEDLRVLAENGMRFLRVFPNWADFQPIHACFLSGGNFDKVYETRMFDSEEPLPDTPCGRAGVDERMVSEINNLARNAGYDLRFREVWSEVREERIKQVREFAAEFIKGNFAGVIYEPLVGPIGDEINPRILSLFDKKKIPVVLLDCDIVPFPDRSHYDVVGVNDLEAGARISKHLLDIGAKNIHFLICSLCPTTFSNRLAGAESQLKLAGVKMPKGGNVLYAEADDLKALKRYLKKQARRPDAFICSNDAIAAVFKQTLEKAGLRVPEDVMLTGFADLSIASLMTPPLTTIRQNREQMAQAAFRRLMARIDDPSLPPCDIFLTAPLIVRGSTEKNVNHEIHEKHEKVRGGV